MIRFAALPVCVLGLVSAAWAEAKIAGKPSVASAGDQVTIGFALTEPGAVEVSVLDSKGAVVRHLAAGLLGKNAPAPFKADALSQSLTWDRKDDDGKAVAGACKVRVAVGLGEKVEKQIGYDANTFRNIAAVAVSPKGELFVLEGEAGYGAAGLRVFESSTGKYLRTIMPMPANTPAERAEPLGVVKPKGGSAIPIVYNAHGQNLTPYTSGLRPQTMGFDPDGNLVLFSAHGTMAEHGPPRFLLFMHPEGGAAKGGFVGPQLQDARGMLGGAGERDVAFFNHLAVAKDGRTIYFAGNNLAKPKHAIFRVNRSDKKPAGPWIGELDTSGSDDTHFNAPAGVALDATGRLYVADRGNNRVVVLDGDGKRLGKFDVPNPLQVYVHPKSGVIYVSSVATDDRGRRGASGIVKFGAFKDGTAAKAAELALPVGVGGRGGVVINSMALDSAGAMPRLWIVTASAAVGPDLVPVDDKGDRLEPGKGIGRSAGLRLPMFVSADLPRGKVYVTELSNSQRQFDIASGEMKIFPKGGESVVDRNGDVTMIEGYPPRVFYYRYDGAGAKKNWPNGQSNAVGPINAASKGPNVGFRGFAWGANGDLYSLEMEFYGDGRVHVYNPDGSLKKENLITHIPNGSTGIAVDRQGNVILGVNIKPPGRPYPADFMDILPKAGWIWWRQSRDAPWDRTYYNAYLYHWGTLFKFPPAGGGFYRNYKEVSQNGDGPMEIPADAQMFTDGYVTKAGKVGVKGALWYFQGYGPVATTNLNWGDPSCVCIGSRMATDDFGRIYSPDAFRFAVNVLDANGNLIGRVGKYGNADDAGVSLSWGAYCSISGDRLFIGDMSNRRVLMVNTAPAESVEVDVK